MLQSGSVQKWGQLNVHRKSMLMSVVILQSESWTHFVDVTVLADLVYERSPRSFKALSTTERSLRGDSHDALHRLLNDIFSFNCSSEGGSSSHEPFPEHLLRCGNILNSWLRRLRSRHLAVAALYGHHDMCRTHCVAYAGKLWDPFLPCHREGFGWGVG